MTVGKGSGQKQNDAEHVLTWSAACCLVTKTSVPSSGPAPSGWRSPSSLCLPSVEQITSLSPGKTGISHYSHEIMFKVNCNTYLGPFVSGRNYKIWFNFVPFVVSNLARLATDCLLYYNSEKPLQPDCQSLTAPSQILNPTSANIEIDHLSSVLVLL